MLLCAIQDRRYRPVGGTKDRKANVRIITATNENLEEAISERRFRRELNFRLSEYTVKVPSGNARKTSCRLLNSSGNYTTKSMADR